MPDGLLKKLGIKPGARAFFFNAPNDALTAIDPSPLDVADKLTGKFDYIHFFAESQVDFNETFPKLKSHLESTGALWVSWRKNRKQGTDLTLTTIIKLGYDFEMVESKVISINADWSAIKFTYPKEGKVYQNSYGKLKSQSG